MDLERLQRLSGRLDELMTPVNVSNNVDDAVKASRKKAEENNKTPKNKSIDDVRMGDKKSDIAQDAIATLTDVDDSGITVKDGKKDINGNKIISKGERLTYTISINPKTGEPKVDDVLHKELINVETWGESAKPGSECFVVASEDGVYLCHGEKDQFVMEDNRSKAAVFASIEQANAIASIFANSTIRRIAIAESSCEDEEDKKECKSCGKAKCACEVCPSCKEAGMDCECDSEKVMEALGQPNPNMLADIKARVDQGQEVRLQMKYNNDQFSGWVKGVSDNFLDVQPTNKTIERFKIQDRVVKLPIDPTTIFWDPNKDNMVRGIAKNIQNMPTQQGQQQAPVANNANRKPFFPGATNMGKANDPTTWQVDMSSKSYDVRPLTEYMQLIKEGRKKFKSVKAREDLPEINNLAAKHAHEFNKAATHEDRKKAEKRGETKYKKDITKDY